MLFSLLQQKLGIMMWPLLISSFIVIVIFTDRVWHLILTNYSVKPLLRQLHQHLSTTHTSENIPLESLVQTKPHTLLSQGISLLITHKTNQKVVREEIVALWLQRQRQKLSRGIKTLSLIGAISPLLGLLGTIVGLIQMFKDISLNSEPVTPALLADGLGIAMYTTAAGLFIALPAIITTYLLNSWVERIMQSTEFALNHYNLWLDGVYFLRGSAK